MKSPRAIRKPKAFELRIGKARISGTGVSAQVDMNMYFRAKELRRLIAWLTRAVEYLESKEKKERKK